MHVLPLFAKPDLGLKHNKGFAVLEANPIPCHTPSGTETIANSLNWTTFTVLLAGKRGRVQAITCQQSRSPQSHPNYIQFHSLLQIQGMCIIILTERAHISKLRGSPCKCGHGAPSALAEGLDGGRAVRASAVFRCSGKRTVHAAALRG